MADTPATTVKRTGVFTRLWLRFAKSALLKLLAICLACLLGFSLLLYAAESGTGNRNFATYGATIRTIMILFISGFEISDAPPQSLLGTLAAFGAVVTGLTSLGLFIAEIASGLVVTKLRGRTGMKPLNLSKHILICGWTKDVPAIIQDLLSEDVKVKRDIVIVDPELEQCPIDDPNVHFVKGDPTDNETLMRAAILTADTAILLADKASTNYNLEDSKNILTALAVETLNRDVHTCVEILNPRNYKHLERAHVDEIICTTEIGNRLITQPALNHGYSKFFNEITSFGEGSEIYRVKLAARFKGKSFAELGAELLKEHKMVLLAIESGGELNINPQKELLVGEDDFAFVLAEDFPDELQG